MPIFFQQDSNETTKLGIWEIGEEEDFFLAHVPLQRTITHPHKRLQHLAGRYLLKYLFPHFPIELIQIADTRKPFLEDEVFHFSIAHCGNYAAAIVSKTERVGLDIELVADKIQRVRHKFISVKETEVLTAHYSAFADKTNPLNLQSQIYNRQSTLLWSCKEAVFKWYGAGGVDFKQHMEVMGVVPAGLDTFETIVLFKKNEDLFLSLHARFFGDLCLSYVVT